MKTDNHFPTVTRSLSWQDEMQIDRPKLMTENELIFYLRIPEVSMAKDYRNVVYNLKRIHNLPRVHICGKPLYPREAIDEWIRSRTRTGK